jgi:hypothetical protein
VLEAPGKCRHFRSGDEYLAAWLEWYEGLDEAVLPGKKAESMARKKKVEVKDAFAGVLVYDLMCLATVQYIFKEEPFKDTAAFVETLPSATFAAKNEAAAKFFRQQAASVVLVQEANELDKDEDILDAFLPPVAGETEETAIFVRRGKFDTVVNIRGSVSTALAEMLGKRYPAAPKGTAEAWAKTISRMAVVKLTSGTRTLCAASLHCKGGEGVTEGTAQFLRTLKIC